MSALNLFVGGDAAHLVTDGALYELDGVIGAIASKVVRSDALCTCIGYSGRTNPVAIADALRARAPTSQAEFLSILPAVAADLRQLNAAGRPQDEADEVNDLQLVVAMFDRAASRPRGFMVSTAPAWMGVSFPVLQLVEVRQIVVPAIDWTPPFSHERALGLLEAQRRSPFRLPTGDQLCVGGFGELHTVSVAGVHREELVRWPDVVGRSVGEGA